jgi:hypothetical protein
MPRIPRSEGAAEALTELRRLDVIPGNHDLTPVARVGHAR